MTQITWLGHATFELKFGTGEVLVLDPWMEGNPKFPKDFKFERIDVVAITHAHMDHFNDVIPLAKQFSPKVVAIHETATWLDGEGVKNTIGVNKGGTVDVGFARLTMTHALHSNSIKDGSKLLYGGEAAGYIIREPKGRTAYFAGDTSLFAEMQFLQEMYAPEIAFLPIGDHYTMGPHEAAHAARLIKPKRVVPMHYGTFPALTGTPAELSEKLTKDGIDVWELEVGKPVQW